MQHRQNTLRVFKHPNRREFKTHRQEDRDIEATQHALCLPCAEVGCKHAEAEQSLKVLSLVALEQSCLDPGSLLSSNFQCVLNALWVCQQDNF